MCQIASGVYRPRRPRASPLWRCAHGHLGEFLGAYEERYRPEYGFLRPVIPDVVNRFLSCGDLTFGFARIRCEDCGTTRLLAFSCKGRYFCPSCHAKKVQLFGEFVRNEVAEAVPHRHWVFSVPKMLRPYFKFDRSLLKDLCRIGRGCLVEWMREALGWPEGVEAAVVAIHTFGEYLDFHPHLHALVADGLFGPGGEFRPLPDAPLRPLEEMFRARVIGFLRGRGLLAEERARMLLGWTHSGFSVHRGRVVEASDGEGLEKLARYILRNPFSVAKMRISGPDGTVIYQSRMNPKTRANFVAFKPADFLAAVTQHIPDGGFHLVRYYGWYSNKMRGQRARRAGHARNGNGADAPEPPSRTSAHWQRLIRKVYEADPLLCPDCGGAMRVVSLVDSPTLIEGTLRGMGLWDPPPSPPCRGPPDDVEKGPGAEAEERRELVPFFEDAAFPDYGAGDGDFRN